MGRRYPARMPDHGTRAQYRAGCRCLRCRAANAAYVAAYRRRRRAPRPLLRTIISPVEARRRIRQLLTEGFSKSDIARRLGLKNRAPRLHPAGITLAKALKIRRLCRQLLIEGFDDDAEDDGEG